MSIPFQTLGLFNSPDAHIDLLKEELKLSFSQLKETLSVARVERKKMAEDILRFVVFLYITYKFPMK